MVLCVCSMEHSLDTKSVVSFAAHHLDQPLARSSRHKDRQTEILCFVSSKHVRQGDFHTTAEAKLNNRAVCSCACSILADFNCAKTAEIALRGT